MSIEVSVKDLDTGERDIQVVHNDYVIVTAGNVYVDGIQKYPGKGTTVITIKTRKAKA